MKFNTILLIIVLMAGLLRFTSLTTVPPSLSLDEVSIGYNAYAIFQTGADEYGSKFPLLLRAYDDWRPATYVYLVIPSVALFGLSPLGVRLPSVLLGILTVLCTYYLVLELFRKLEIENWKLRAIALLSAFSLAISPWHIYLSRLSHEVNLGLTLIVFGVYSFFRAINSRKDAWWLVVSAVALGLSLNSYQSQKIITPVLIISLGLLFWKQLLLNKKQLLISVILGLAIALPIIFASIQPEALIRLRATSAASPNQRKIETMQIVSFNYLSHFRPSWLFSGEGRESHKVPGLGLLYVWEFPLMLLGIVWLIRVKRNARVKIFLLLWLLSAPFPAAITTQAPHAMRSFTFLPVLQLFGAAGFVSLWKKQTIYAWLTLGLFVVVSLSYFVKQYFLVFPKTQSDSFQYALTRAIPWVLEKQDAYDQIVFSNASNLYQSYMFFLFYSRYDPVVYQKEGGTHSGGFEEVHTIGKFEFRPIIWEKEKKDGKSLYIGNNTEFPSSISGYELPNLDGTPAIKIVGS